MIGDRSARVRARSVARRYADLRERIAAAGGGPEVGVVAVTKAFGAWAIDAAAVAGIACVGENYAQECLSKLSCVTVEPRPELHFIGRLQRNKVKRLAGCVDVWQSVDRARLVDEIARRAPGARVMIQVNVSGSMAQGGCEHRYVETLASRVDGCGLRLEGLMAIGPHPDAGGSRRCFRQLRRMVDTLGLSHCSMGMSADLEAAVAEGATMVRVGTGLFGAR